MAQLHIPGTGHPRPASRRTVYCDGTHDALWREGLDLELSHWSPNVTPAAYKADTSTGIARRFVAAGAPGGCDLVVNDHVDTDGVLAAFVLLHPALGAAHGALLDAVAAMGDFQADGDEAARALYQALTQERVRLEAMQPDPLDRAQALHAVVQRWLTEPAPPAADPGLQALARADAHLAAGRITRRLLAPRLVQFVVPADLLPAPFDAALQLPRVDRPLQPGTALPPALRNRHDGERLQLLSFGVAGGWVHALAWPGYAWADTVDRWRPPGLEVLPGENEHRLVLPGLDDAVAALDRLEGASSPPGRWQRAAQLSVFGGLAGHGFPIVLGRVNGARVAASTVAPETFARVLAPVLG